MLNDISRFLRSNAPWLAAGALLALISSFGQTFFISVFAGEIRAEYDLSHGSWGTIYALGTTASAILMIWMGALTDRYRARNLGTWVLIGLALACLAMAANSVLWLLPFVILSLRLMGQGMASHIAVVAMARWFIATRGKALAVATLGFAIGEMTLPLVFVMLLDHFDWRVLWVAAAGLSLLSIPLLRTLLKEERVPTSHDQNDVRTGMAERHWTRMEAIRHPLFWFVVPAIAGLSAFGTALLFHQVHFAAIKGISHLTFVSLLPVYTSVGIVSMVISGIALDRFGTARLLPYYQLPLVAGFLVFALAQSVLALALAFALIALTAGANSTLPNAFWAEAYGTAHIGAIKAIAAASMVLGSAIGPLITGLMIDFGIGLETQFAGVSAYFLFTSLGLLIGVRRYFNVSA